MDTTRRDRNRKFGTRYHNKTSNAHNKIFLHSLTWSNFIKEASDKGPTACINNEILRDTNF